MSARELRVEAHFRVGHHSRWRPRCGRSIVTSEPAKTLTMKRGMACLAAACAAGSAMAGRLSILMKACVGRDNFHPE